MAAMLWILVKETQTFGQETTRILPFKLNRIQRDIEAHLDLWNLLLKPRQTGGTTYFTLRRLLVNAVLEGGIGCLLISQSNEYASEHFRIVHRAYDLFGAVDPAAGDDVNVLAASLKKNLLHTKYSNRRELVFDFLDSKVRIASAEVEEAGQGITLHHIVASEYARWPGDPESTLSNVMGALVPKNTTGIVPRGTLDRESTANGAAGPFYEACLRALEKPEISDSKIHYYPHWWEDGYMASEFQMLDGTVVDIENATPKQLAECIADLESTEALWVKMLHKELDSIAWVKAA